MPKSMLMSIQLRSILIHHHLRRLHCILMLQSGRPAFFIYILLLASKILLLFWMLIHEQVFDSAFASCSLIDRKASGELLMCADLYGVKHVDGEVLAIVAYQIVSGPGGAHVVDCHFG
jgi:hypothetical protein